MPFVKVRDTSQQKRKSRRESAKTNDPVGSPDRHMPAKGPKELDFDGI